MARTITQNGRDVQSMAEMFPYNIMGLESLSPVRAVWLIYVRLETLHILQTMAS